MATEDILLTLYFIIWGQLESGVFLFWCLSRRQVYGTGNERRTCLWIALTVLPENLMLMVVLALWPVYPVMAICCPRLWRGMGAVFWGIFDEPEPHMNTSGQDNETVDTSRISSISTRRNCDWHRRGWLVLLRARHQRIAAARLSSRWRWTGCCSKRDNSGDVLMGVISHSSEEHDLEGGLESVAHDTAASEFQQLLIRVVEYEEEGVFRSIVGYL